MLMVLLIPSLAFSFMRTLFFFNFAACYETRYSALNVDAKIRSNFPGHLLNPSLATHMNCIKKNLMMLFSSRTGLLISGIE